MNRSDSDVREPGDEPIRHAVLGLPFPETPRTLAQHIRRRVRQRQTRRRAIAGTSAVAVLLAAALLWWPWSRPLENTLARRDNQPDPAAAAVAELDAGTLNSLFALPPVDTLAVLNRRLDMAFLVLNSKENNR